MPQVKKIKMKPLNLDFKSSGDRLFRFKSKRSLWKGKSKWESMCYRVYLLATLFLLSRPREWCLSWRKDHSHARSKDWHFHQDLFCKVEYLGQLETYQNIETNFEKKLSVIRFDNALFNILVENCSFWQVVF